MKFYFLFLIFIALYSTLYCRRATPATQPLRQRIQILRNQLKEEIRQHIYENEDDDKYAFSDENYDFIEKEERSNNDRITPIMDPKLQKRKRKLRTTKNEPGTLSTTTELSNITTTSNAKKSSGNLRSKGKKKKSKVKKPLDIFYRRQYDDEILHEPIRWAHCHYMIMPYLMGMKKDISTSKGCGPKDPTVVRLIQLLSVNTTSLTKEDIYSILYQISHLQIRLFQWDVAPIKMLLNVVIRDKIHTFRTLKHGVQALFNEWKLDVSNATSLLKQTRVFRPPCVRVSELDGSTKSPRITIYPKKQTQPTKCSKDDNGDDSF